MITLKQIQILTVFPEEIVLEATRAYRKPALVQGFAKMRGKCYIGPPSTCRKEAKTLLLRQMCDGSALAVDNTLTPSED